jgi:hypothetical protein
MKVKIKEFVHLRHPGIRYFLKKKIHNKKLFIESDMTGLENVDESFNINYGKWWWNKRVARIIRVDNEIAITLFDTKFASEVFSEIEPVCKLYEQLKPRCEITIVKEKHVYQ